MPSLSSLIVQRQVATIAEVEQAIARQVIHGGDLVTNLLEVSPQCEHSLTRVLAESLGIPSVPPGRLPAPDNEVLDIVPVETALRYGIFPLRLSAKTLVIATSERLKPTALHDLAYTLGLDISQVAAPIIRIREGIAAHYGVPLEPRQLRLVQKLDSFLEGGGLAPARPPVAQLPTSPSILPSNLGSGVSTHPAAPESANPSTRRKGSTLEMEEVRGVDSARPSVPPVRDTPVDLPRVEEPPSEPTAAEPPTPAEPEAPEEPAAEQAPEEPAPPEEPSVVEPSAQEEEEEAAAAAPEVSESVEPQPLLDDGGEPSSPDVAFPEEDGEIDEAAHSGRFVSAAPPVSEENFDAYDADALDRHTDVGDEPSPEQAEEDPEARESLEGTPSTQRESGAAEPETISFPPGDSPRPPGMVDRKAVAKLLKREVGSRKKVTAKSARKKGPFSRVDAERELEAARSPDDVLSTFFAFGSQFFEYSALFVVHGDLIEGRDAWGPGADHLRVLGLGVPLDLPSSLALVRREGNVYLSRFDELDLDRELLRDLDRGQKRSRTAALVPLTVKRRAVAMLYGDDGDTDVTLGSIGDLLGFSALASSQIERIALAKKAKGGPFAGIVAPRAQPQSVAALARAFSLPLPQASGQVVFTQSERVSGSAPPVPPQVSPGATSVHPPAPITSSFEDEEEVTLARRPKSAAPAALAETEIPSLDNKGAIAPPRQATQASFLGLAEIASGQASSFEEHLDADAADAFATREIERSLLTPQEGAMRSSHPALASPLPPMITAERSPSVPVVPRDRSSRPQGFVPPIPRVDDDDASALVAEHVDAGYDATPPPIREESEPFHQDGRAYHLVPRPADARSRAPSSDLQHLLERATAGGLEGEEALSELLRRAEVDFPKLVERFPGPLVVDRLRARADLPPASECGPLLKVLVMMRRGSLPFMTVRSASTDVEQRFWSTHVLGELLLPEASNAILPRLFDDDVSVRRVARRAAQALAAAGAPGEPLKHSLAHTMHNADEPMQRRMLAIEALSDIRVPSVVPILIQALRDESDSIIEAARTALMIVTRQDLGRNPSVWTAWWEMHSKEHRVEWLIQSLTHEVPSIRRAAGDELKMLTREYFGYYDDLPPKERERAQARYVQWWKDEGQYRFR